MSGNPTLRDQFAMAALTGLCANPKLVWEHQPTPSTSFDDPPGMGYGEPIFDFAKESYQYADAMMAASADTTDESQLIAAAPDMLEALELLIKHITDMQAVCGRYLVPDSGISQGQFVDAVITNLDGPEERSAMRIARAAIAKAKGEA